jgi:hypothetical protein
MMHSIRVLLTVALALLATVASAQLSTTMTVQRNFVVAPNSGSYSLVSADCPAGYSVLSGGLDSVGTAAIELTSHGPTFGGNRLVSQPNGTTGAARGWLASVINYGDRSWTVMVTAVCAQLSNVHVVINSASVNASSTTTGSGAGTAEAMCPAGEVAIGGGVDVTNPESMKLTSTSPRYATGNAFLADRAPGTNPAAAGWSGYVSNQGTVAGGVMKVAAICVAPTQLNNNVVTVVSQPVAVAQAKDNYGFLLCPAGFVALGGGFDSNDLHELIGTVSTPIYNGAGFALDRPSGDYSAPGGWLTDTFSESPLNDVRGMTVGLVCAQAASVNAGALVTVYEFYNTALKHYFRTSSPTEAASIDHGSAGMNWVRTGDNFTAYAAGNVAPGADVCRFYTFGANSHFYTAFADECNGLKGPNSGWVYEGLSFHIQLPASSGVCPAGTIQVHRLYNNRFVQNDSNHRFTTVFPEIATLQAQGWKYEGVAFCSLNYSAGV